jgi:alpha/beta superfamily hydrolase
MSATLVNDQPDQRSVSRAIRSSAVGAVRSPAGRAVRSIDLAGPAGRLEAVLNEGVPDASFAALISHPHPLFGGTLHNKVVYRAMKAVNDPAFGLGWPVLRFNFRGAGLSQGEHDGQAEAGDVEAAFRWLENEYKLPVVAIGFSFGAAMTIAACCAGPVNPAALVALGLPIQSEGRSYQYSGLENYTIPKLFLSGDQDQFAPADELVRVFASAADPKRLVLLPSADHFFSGHLAAMQSSLAGWLKEQLL